MESLGSTPDRCDWPHVQQYAAPVFDRYRVLVDELAHRRRSLGLSQEDVGGSSGLADGHVNKLEAIHRVAQFPTLQLWASTLGLKLALVPAQLPSATIAAIENRPAPLRETEKTIPQTPQLVGE